jgi:hypothetical protein
MLTRNDAPYLLRRLARHRPDLLEAYERGDYPSARAVAKVTMSPLPLGSNAMRLRLGRHI